MRVQVLGTCPAPFVLAVLLAGCGSKAPEPERRPLEEKLLIEQIEALDQWTAELAKVTNKATFEQAQPAIAKLSARVQKLSEQFNTLPVERKAAAILEFSEKMQAATARLVEAKSKAKELTRGE